MSDKMSEERLNQIDDNMIRSDLDELIAEIRRLRAENRLLHDTVKEAKPCIEKLQAENAALRERAELYKFVPDEHGGHLLTGGNKWYPESYTLAKVRKMEEAIKEALIAMASYPGPATDKAYAILKALES